MAKATGRLVVITGTTRGLGRALAEGMARAGHKVVGCGRSAGAIEHHGAATGHPHDFASVDVTHDPAVKAWAERVLAEHGPPDLLINNAALINANAPLWTMPAAEFESHGREHGRGRQRDPAIRPGDGGAQRGVIINLSSGWGRDLAGGGALLRDQVGDRGPDQGPGRGAAARHGGHPAQPRRHRHRHAPDRFGDSAGEPPGPRAWARRRSLHPRAGPKDNGKPATVPGQ